MTDLTKTCPYCAETIKLAAIRCRFCHADLDSSKEKQSDPLEDDGLVSSSTLGDSGRLLAAAVGSFACAAYAAVVCILQASSGFGILAGWNLLVAVADVVIGILIIQRHAFGYSAGLWTNALNIALQVASLLIAGWHAFALLIPIELMIVSCLAGTRPLFRAVPKTSRWDRLGAELADY